MSEQIDVAGLVADMRHPGGASQHEVEQAADMLEAVDRVLRHIPKTVTGAHITDHSRWEGTSCVRHEFRATSGNERGQGPTPWAALLDLAAKLELKGESE